VSCIAVGTRKLLHGGAVAPGSSLQTFGRLLLQHVGRSTMESITKIKSVSYSLHSVDVP
jgi:hypothetical protein